MMTLAAVVGGDSPSFFVGRIYSQPSPRSLLWGETSFLPLVWDESKKALVISNKSRNIFKPPAILEIANSISLDILYEASADNGGNCIELVMPDKDGITKSRKYSTLVQDIPLAWNSHNESFTIISEEENEAIQELTR